MEELAKEESRILKVLQSELWRGYCLEDTTERCTARICSNRGMRSWQLGRCNSNATVRLSEGEFQLFWFLSGPWSKRYEQQLFVEELRSVFEIRTSKIAKSSWSVSLWKNSELSQRMYSQLVFIRLYKQWLIYSFVTKLWTQVYGVKKVMGEHRYKLKAIRRTWTEEAKQNRRKLRTYHLQTLESSLY